MSLLDRYWTQSMVTLLVLGLLAFDAPQSRRATVLMVGLAYAIGLGVSTCAPSRAGGRA